MPTVYPIVLGHEIVGRVTSIGAGVTKLNIGDVVVVGCLVDAEPTCPHCRANREQYSSTNVLTDDSRDKHGTAPDKPSTFPPSRARMRVGVRKFGGESYGSYCGRGLAAPSRMRSNTRPPHSPGRLSAVSIASNSGQTHNDRRLNPFARIFRLYVSSRSEFVDAINISSVVTYAPQIYATSRGSETLDFPTC